LHGWPQHKQFVACLTRKAELIDFVLLSLQRSFPLFSQQEVIKSQSVNRLDLLFEDLGDWVPLALEQVNEVHYFLLSQSQVGNLILQGLQQILQFNVLSDEHVNILNQPLIHVLDLLMEGTIDSIVSGWHVVMRRMHFRQGVLFYCGLRNPGLLSVCSNRLCLLGLLRNLLPQIVAALLGG